MIRVLFALLFSFSAFGDVFETSVTEMSSQILNRYEALSVCTNDLVRAIESSQQEAAQEKWFECRTIWESGESHTFGPATLDGFDEKMDSWPLDTKALESLLLSKQLNDLSDIVQLDPSLRGFHAIEYILFARSDAGSEALLFAQDLAQSSQGLLEAWTQFQSTLFERGADAIFPQGKDVALEILTGVVESLQELADAKLKEPVTEDDARLIESAFAKNALIDFSANLTGAFEILKPFLNHSVHKDAIARDFESAILNLNAIGSYEEAFQSPEGRQQILEISAEIIRLAERIDSDLRAEWL